MTWLLERLREPSTWRGLIWLATACGVSLKPDLWEAITAAGMALAGLLGVVLADEPKTVRIELPPPTSPRSIYGEGGRGGEVGGEVARPPAPAPAPERLRPALPARPGPEPESGLEPPPSGWNG